MNVIAKVVVSFAAVAAPVLALAQDPGAALTRAQVKAELAQLERAGYSPAIGENANYPVDVQAAEARVAAAQQSAPQSNESYGGVYSGQRAAGAPSQLGSKGCVGPAGFCNPYFGS